MMLSGTDHTCARHGRVLMHVRGRGLGTNLGGEVVGLNLPHRDAADLRISEFHIRHMRLLCHQRLQAVAAFIQILDQCLRPRGAEWNQSVSLPVASSYS